MSIPEPTQWNGAPGDEREHVNGGIQYGCMDCKWHGKSAHAADHHREHHHRILIAATGQLAMFSCCPNASALDEREPDPDTAFESRRLTIQGGR